MLPICGGQDLPMIEVKSIFENVHFVDYGGRSDSGRYKFIKTLIIVIEDEYGNTPAQRAELDWLLI